MVHHKVDPVVVSADQMPLHRNETADHKTLNFSGSDQHVFVKENYQLSRERTSVMTTVASNGKHPPLEFVFKAKTGATILKKIKPPKSVTVQTSPRGSYREEHVIKFIEKLPQLPVQFLGKPAMKIFTLDNYSAHLGPDVRKALLKKGYFLIGIPSGITGDVQVNDTHMHHLLKAKYRDYEMETMLKKLDEEPDKIPAPDRDDLMKMCNDAFWRAAEQMDAAMAFKQNLITLALDGSEDYIASDRLWKIVGQEMKAFRADLLKETEGPKDLAELVERLIPPAGVRRKSGDAPSGGAAPVDEGFELLDGEETDGDEDLELEDEREDEEVPDTSRAGPSGVNKDASLSPEPEVVPPEPEVVPPEDDHYSEELKCVKRIADYINTEKERCPSLRMMPFFTRMNNIIEKQRRACQKNQYNDELAFELANVQEEEQGSNEEVDQDMEDRCAFDLF
jgi:hypothetical protein